VTFDMVCEIEIYLYIFFFITKKRETKSMRLLGTWITVNEIYKELW